MIGLISWWGRQKDWNCILVGRTYHISPNTTIHATREFWEVLGDKLGVNTDLYYHFHWFPKRKNILMEFNYFCDRKYSKITRLHSVRLFRLSSECLTRAIQLFSALRKSSFFSQDADIRDREIASCYLNSLINFFSSLHWHHWWIFVFFKKRQDPIINAMYDSLSETLYMPLHLFRQSEFLRHFKTGILSKFDEEN